MESEKIRFSFTGPTLAKTPNGQSAKEPKKEPKINSTVATFF